MTTGTQFARHVLPTCNFLSKGWEVSILGLLAFLQYKYKLSLYMVGFLSTVFIVSQISISIFAGTIAHALRSHNVILLSITASALAWGVLLSMNHTGFLFLAFACGGVSSGLFEPIGNSLVAKLSSGKTRATDIGNFAAYGDMGRIGVAAGATALAGLIGLTATFAILLGTSVVAFVLAYLWLRGLEQDQEAAANEDHVEFRALLQNTKFCYATGAGIADSFSSASLYIFIPFLLVAKGIALVNTGWYVGIFFVGYFTGRLGLGRMADKYGVATVLMFSKFTMAVLLVILTLVSANLPIIVVLMFLLGIFTRGSSPIIRAMVANSMDRPNSKVSFHNAFSAYSFASRGSSALCRPIFGFLAGSTGIASVFYLASAVSLLTLYPAAKYRAQ